MRVGGVEVRVDRGRRATPAATRTNAAVAYEYGAVASMVDGVGGESGDGASEETSEGESERESEESEDWSDDGSLDDAAAMDYAENARAGGEMRDDGEEEEEDEEEEEEEEESDGSGDELSDARLARELRAIASMNLDGGLPEPRWDSSEDEAFALERDEDEDEECDDDREDVAMEKLSRVIGAAIDAGVAYVGLPPVKSSPNAPSLDDAARVARAHKCALEIRGGGKRRHAIIHIDALSSKVPASFVKTRVSQRAKKTNSSKKPRRTKPAVQFVSGGIAKEGDEVFKSDDDEDPRKRPVEPVPDEPAVYPNRGARRAAEAQARDREFIEKARARKRGVVVGAGHEFGAFEKHTTGFGSRMLAKMGFKGKGSGLGSGKTEGIAEPVTASTRGKRVGLGAFGAER